MIKLSDILLELLSEKKLCPKGRAYYNRRIAAGEKPSAYLSGRAVKVCKGLMEEDTFNSNFSKIDQIITKDHSKEIYQLLLGMFPNAKEVIDYQYNDEDGQPFAEWRRSIYEIDNHILTGPKTIDPKKLKLDPTTIADRQAKYDQYIKDKKAGKSAKYFRNNLADPRNIDYTKLPPITVLEKGGEYEVIDGGHRAFLAKMNNKPLKAYIWKKQSNTHPNVVKIKALFNNLDESLRDWFKKEDWVRIDTQGNITGPCGTMKKGKATTRCLPRAKANRLTKAERAATARKKVAGSKKGKQFVANTEKAKVKFNKQ